MVDQGKILFFFSGILTGFFRFVPLGETVLENFAFFAKRFPHFMPSLVTKPGFGEKFFHRLNAETVHSPGRRGELSRVTPMLDYELLIDKCGWLKKQEAEPKVVILANREGFVE